MVNRFGNVQIPSLNPQDAWQKLAANNKETGPLLIDVRETWEFRSGHARGALHIPMGEVLQRLHEIPTDRDVFIICQSGSRSGSVVKYLTNNGYTRVFNVTGGTGMWQILGLPIE